MVFSDNADDEVSMVPMNGLEFAWEQYFYDYGDITRPGSLVGKSIQLGVHLMAMLN